jgi:hypothetical protein
VRIDGFRCGVVATLTVLAVSSCGNPTPSPTVRHSPTPTPARPSAAAGPCASVAATTAIGDVSAACAALWAPYGVTKVPPANLTDSTPPAPSSLVNATNGALSDSDLAQLITASNRDSLWYRWAEANDQPSLMPRLGDVRLDPAAELQAMAANEPVTQPDCALFPTKLSVFVISQTDRRFFASQPRTAADQYVFVGTYPGSCSVTALKASGEVVTIASYPTVGTTFFASHLVQDSVLGPILFYDGAGNCSQTGAPDAWCHA